VFSYDISRTAEETARRCFGHFKNFRLINKSQSDFSPEDIENRKIDLCFIDASHDLAHNLKTFELIRPASPKRRLSLSTTPVLGNESSLPTATMLFSRLTSAGNMAAGSTRSSSSHLRKTGSLSITCCEQPPGFFTNPSAQHQYTPKWHNSLAKNGAPRH
jgi:hypothetical protein